jgi:hypothetical protein
MANDLGDLWPNLEEEVPERTPVRILREQASLLVRKTGGLVQAFVRTAARGELFEHRFILAVRRLEDYEYELFTIQHDMSVYPLQAYVQGASSTLKNEEEFVAWLRDILSAKRTVQIIRTLISQVK